VKLTDVVAQLQAVLPKYTDYFSRSLTISSISVASNVATITTDKPHGVLTGEGVTISDVGLRTAIATVSQDGLTFTFTTLTDHDLTYGWPDHEYVTLAGFVDSAWNDSFKLLDVPNRRTFTVQSTNSLPSLVGAEYLQESRIDGINGRHSVTVTGADTFTISGTFTDGTYSGGTVKTAVRIAGAVTAERAIEQYTKQGTDDLWLFVLMRDVETSKDRQTNSDARLTAPSGTSMRLRTLDGFTLMLVKNVTDDITANNALDIARHELLGPILKSVYGARFTTGLNGSADFKTVLLGHNFVDYDRATFVYAYSFECPMDITDDDAVEPEDTRAFRDIDYTHTIGGDGTTDVTGNINLDEVSL